MLRTSVMVDADQYDKIDEYCGETGATRAWCVRDAIALWLTTRARQRMKAFREVDKETGPAKLLQINKGDHK